MPFDQTHPNIASSGDDPWLEELSDKYIRDLKKLGYTVDCKENCLREELYKNCELAHYLLELYKSAPGGCFALDPSHCEVYESMESKGEILYGDELEIELYGNNLSDMEEEIKYLEERIKLEEAFLQDSESLELQLEAQIKVEKTNLENLDKVKKESHVQMMKVRDSCINESNSVFQIKCELMEEFHRVVSSSKECHSVLVEGCILDEELEQLEAEFDNYLSVLRKFKSELLETPRKDHPRCKSSRNIELLRSLQQIKDSLLLNKHICMKLSVEERGLTAGIMIGNKLLESLKSETFVFKENQIQSQIQEWEKSKTCRYLLQEFDSVLSSAAQITAESYILPYLLEASKEKFNHLESWLSTAKVVAKFIEAPKNLSEVIPLILYNKQREVMNLYDLINLFNQYVVQDAAEVSVRMEIATDNAKDNEKNVLEPICKSLDSNCFSLGDEDFYKDNIQLVDKIENLNNKIIKKQSLFLSSWGNIKQILLQNEMYLDILMNNLTCSRNKDKKFELKLESIENQLNKLECENEAKLQLLTQKPFLKHQRLLWVYILCNQEKLESVVSDIQKSVKIKCPQQETSKDDPWHYLLK